LGLLFAIMPWFSRSSFQQENPHGAIRGIGFRVNSLCFILTAFVAVGALFLGCAPRPPQLLPWRLLVPDNRRDHTVIYH